nr:putative FBD-associated F-box protein At5g50270 isoform X2 [Setaria viridis]
MESTKDDDVDEPTKQQTEPSPPAGDQSIVGAADLLSGLCDDVLVHILGLAKDAKDAVRTGALSRRWRGLWRRVPALRFASRQGNAKGFMAFVDDTLALRARSGDGGLEQLEIRLNMRNAACRNERLVPPSIGAAERWIRYAVRHGVKSFQFELDLPKEDDEDEDEEAPVMVLDELPSSAKLEAMFLDLSYAWVSLPATVVFASLTDLKLEFMKVAGDNVLLLGRLVSSACCPNLRKLHMFSVTLAGPGQQKLLVEAGVLKELSLEEMDGMRSLELRAPSLRVLRIEDCDDLESLAASAPRLEKLSCRGNPLLIIDGDFPSVSLLKLDLKSHGHAYGDDSNYGRIKLLQRCRSASRLSIDFDASMRESHGIDIIKASLLTGTTFSNIRYLCLDFFIFYEIALCPGAVRKSNFICDHRKSHEISFIHLKEAEFRRVRGTDCELGFLQYVLSGATQLQKVILSFKHSLKRRWNDDFRTIQEHSSLIKNRCKDFRENLLASGTWTDCHDTTDKCHSYEWRPCQ